MFQDPGFAVSGFRAKGFAWRSAELRALLPESHAAGAVVALVEGLLGDLGGLEYWVWGRGQGCGEQRLRAGLCSSILCLWP